MAFTLLADQFNLPAEDFIRTIVQERFPTLDVRKGTALYRLVIKPAALLIEPYRRMQNVLRRNQTILAFEDMLEYELDQLMANYFIDRRTSSTATGIVRVYVSEAVELAIPLSARFSTNTGLIFQPSSPVVATAAELLLNESGGYYYADVPVIAEAPGADYVIESGTIVNFEGVSADFVDNPSATAGGQNIESNSELVERSRGTIATRTLTSENGIRATLLDNFDSVTGVDVIGYLDAEMERDVIQAVTSFRELFGVRFARKVNVWVDPTTNLPTSSPTGVYKAAIIDVQNTYADSLQVGDPYFFHKLEVDADTVESYEYSVQRGDMVVISTNGGSVDDGRYTVLNVIFGVWKSGEANTHFLLLDGVFADTAFDAVTPNNADFTKHEYTIESSVRVDEFHVGGKADIYVNSTNISEQVIQIPQVTTVTGSSPARMIDIPISAIPVTYSDVGATTLGSTSLYEDSQTFLLPFLDIVSIEVIDFSNAALVLRTLDRGADYTFITRNPDTRFTEQEDSFIRLLDDSLATSGARLKITYQTNSDIPTIQAFVSDPENRDTTADLLVRSVKPIQVDFLMSYAGTPTIDEVTGLLEAYVESRPQGGTIRASDVVAFLQVFGVTSVTLPLTMTAVSFADDGSIESQVSTNSISIGVREIFQLSASQQITKLE